MSQPLITKQFRGVYVENIHHAWAVVTDRQGDILYESHGAMAARTFFRSAAKPFQAMPLILENQHTALSQQDLAILCASHNGTAQHIAQTQSVLDQAGLSEQALQCGPDRPIGVDAYHELIETGQAPTRLHNNCSGKHAGMLYYCRKKNWDLQTYLSPEHPLQKQIADIIQEWGNHDEPLSLAVDGCGAPTFYLPLTVMARLYAVLSEHPAARPAVEAMTAYPVLVGGQGRSDSTLMAVTQGRLLAKVGGDGVLGVSHLERRQGFFLKVIDGHSAMRDRMSIALLHHLGWLSDEEYTDPRLRPFTQDTCTNTQGINVGTYQTILTGNLSASQPPCPATD